MTRLALLALVVISCSFPIYGQDNVLARARLQLQKGQTASAISLLQDYRRQHPTNAEVCGLLGMAYSQQGNPDEALAMFKEFVRLAPGRPDAYVYLGATYVRLGKTAQAEQSFRHALSMDPNNANTLYNLGALLNTQHQYSSAHSLLLRALQRDRSPEVIFQLTLSLWGLGEQKKALQLLRSEPVPAGRVGVPWLRLLGSLCMDQGDWIGATSAFNRVLALAPNDRVSLYGLGLAQLKSGHVDKAIPFLERSLASVAPARRHLDVGGVLAKNGADAAAETEFERAIVLDPKSYDAYYNLAIVRLRQKKLDGAAQAATKALEIHSSAEIHNLLGDILEDQGRYSEALKHFQAAVHLEPNNEQYVLDLGLELIRHQNSAVAHDLFLAAHKTFPKSARIALGLGTADHMDGKNAEAVQAFLTAVKLDPDYEPAYTFLGEAYAFAGDQSAEVLSRLGQLAETHKKSFAAQYYYGSALVTEMEHSGNLSKLDGASSALRLAASLRPGDGRTYYYLGEIQRLRKDIPGASRLYEKAVALNPTMTDALYRLGWSYVRMGRREEAQRIFARQRAVTTRESTKLRKWMEQIQQFVLKRPETR